MTLPVDNLIAEMERVPDWRFHGEVLTVRGLVIECAGLNHVLTVGSRCHIDTNSGQALAAEVIGFREGSALLMGYGNLEGVGPGNRVTLHSASPVVYPSESWLGRVLSGMGEARDPHPDPLPGTQGYLLRGTPPPAHLRRRVGPKLDLGVRALNTFITCCEGQRLGIFAGSGVGKSIMMGMMAQYSAADVNVIGLIGERGREVQEFVEDILGEEGLKRSVVIVATSDEPALLRRQAAWMTLAVAEYFRDRGAHVLCMMDSVTRFAMAQREIGLSVGEPPTTRGYTPTVFSELPRLLERAGPGERGSGSITGLFSVLVEGDDHNEPVSDAVRGILDGHIVLERRIAERGRYPAINILKSVSRMLPDCNSDPENAVLREARRLMATYDDMEEMIRLGAYRQGSDRAVDEAIHYHPALEAFLSQDKREPSTLAEGYGQLAGILGMKLEAEQSEQG